MKKVFSDKKEIIKYIVTGVINNGVFFIIYYLMLCIGIGYKVSYVIGSIGMIIIGFSLNKKWVFENKESKKIIIIKYSISVIVFIILGIELTEILIWTNLFNKYNAVILTVGICAVLSYIVNKKIVFEK